MSDLLNGLRIQDPSDAADSAWNDCLDDVAEALRNPPQEWVDDHVDHIAVHAFLAAPGGEGRNWMMLPDTEKDRWRGVVTTVLRMAVDQ